MSFVSEEKLNFSDREINKACLQITGCFCCEEEPSANYLVADKRCINYSRIIIAYKQAEHHKLLGSQFLTIGLGTILILFILVQIPVLNEREN